MATPAGTHGFWRGLATGLAVAGLAALALAWAFPPLRAPDVAAEALLRPAAPEAPDRVAAAPDPTVEGLLPAPAPAPLIEGLTAEPSPTRPADTASLVPLGR